MVYVNRLLPIVTSNANAAIVPIGYSHFSHNLYLTILCPHKLSLHRSFAPVYSVALKSHYEAFYYFGLTLVREYVLGMLVLWGFLTPFQGIKKRKLLCFSISRDMAILTPAGTLNSEFIPILQALILLFISFFLFSFPFITFSRLPPFSHPFLRSPPKLHKLKYTPKTLSFFLGTYTLTGG